MRLEYIVEYGNQWGLCEGELLPEIAPHLAHCSTYAVGRGHGKDSFWWIVTNLETGFRVGFGYTKKEAIQKAAAKLATKNSLKVFAAYRKALTRSKPLALEAAR